MTWRVIAMSQANATSRQRSASDMEGAFLFAHKSNIERYKKLLQTHLTDHERLFVQRRLDEETAALQQLARIAKPV